jgi:holo-[acyl-carrier protein] synthase
MEQIRLGIDIIEISRVRLAIDRWHERFLERVYTQNELRLYQNKVESLAARFAAKEAVMKALGAPRPNISWKEVEILSDPDGMPVLRLYGQALDQLNRLGLKGLEVSLSHSRENAIALVIGLRER